MTRYNSVGESAFDEGKPVLSLQTGRAYGKKLHRKSHKRRPTASKHKSTTSGGAGSALSRDTQGPGEAQS